MNTDRPNKTRQSAKKTHAAMIYKSRGCGENWPFVNRYEQNAIFRGEIVLRGISVSSEMEAEITSKTLCNSKEEAYDKAGRYAAAKLRMSYGY